MDQEGVDAGSSRRPEGVAKDLMRLFQVDIAHDVEVTVQEAVADGCDDDISDLAMIDAGNLPNWLRCHGGGPWCGGGLGRVRSGTGGSQECVVATEIDFRLLQRHIVLAADFTVKIV